MKYNQLDRIVEIRPGELLIAERTLRADEEYLVDHFPKFPVMPGVMMLEALHQAAVWMIRTGCDFTPPLVRLKEVRGVKFGDFLCPGETLTVIVRLLKQDGPHFTVKATAEKAGRTTVLARLILEKRSPAADAAEGTEALLRDGLKRKFEQLFGPIDKIIGGEESECPAIG